MKLVAIPLMATLAIIGSAYSYPTYFHAGSDMVYLDSGSSCLSSDSCEGRKKRQTNDAEDDGSSFRQLLLEIRQVAARVVINYGCAVDVSGSEFTQKFLTAYAGIVPNVSPDETIKVTAKKIIAQVLTDYGCPGGRVSWTDPAFEERFKAAFTREILEAGDGDATTRQIAALMMSNKYGCGKINPNGKEFIERFLAIFYDVVERAKIRVKEADYDPNGTDLTRYHIAQLIKKYRCGNPDYDSEEFKNNFFISQLTVALS